MYTYNQSDEAQYEYETKFPIHIEPHLIIDGIKAQFIDHDILETIADFISSAAERNINVELNGLELAGINPGHGH